MSSSIIVALIVIIMALLGTLVSFRIIFTILSIIILVTGILMFIIVRSVPATTSTTEPQQMSFTNALNILAKSRQFWLSVIFFSTGFGALLALADLWNVPTQIAYRHTIQSAAMLNSMFPLGGAFGALFSGWIADYLKRRAIVAKYYITGMLVFTIILVYGPAFSTGIAFTLLFILGFFFGGIVIGFPLVAQNIAEDLQGTGFGFMSMVAYLLCACLQFIVGGILGAATHALKVTAISQFKIALTPIVVILVIGWLCSLWLKDPQTKETQHG